LDRNPGELTIHREEWNGQVAGGERFPKGSMELKLYARGFKEVALDGIEDGPILRAHIKRDEAPSPDVPWATSNGDGCMCGDPGWGKVVRADPPGGGFHKTQDSVYLRLPE